MCHYLHVDQIKCYRGLNFRYARDGQNVNLSQRSDAHYGCKQYVLCSKDS